MDKAEKVSVSVNSLLFQSTTVLFVFFLIFIRALMWLACYCYLENLLIMIISLQNLKPLLGSQVSGLKKSRLSLCRHRLEDIFTNQSRDATLPVTCYPAPCDWAPHKTSGQSRAKPKFDWRELVRFQLSVISNQEITFGVGFQWVCYGLKLAG